MSLNQISSNNGTNTFLPAVSLREVNITDNINFGSDAKISEPSPGVVQIQSNELKWQSNDSKDHFRCYADGVFSHYEFTGDDTGGLLCDFKVPSTESPYDLRIAIGNPSGNFFQNKGLLLFQDSTGTLAGQELLIRDSGQPGGSGVAFPNTTAGYVASTLNYYEEFATILTVTGLTSVANIAVNIIRIGKNVTLAWDSTGLGTGLGTTITTSAIPTRFRPLASKAIAIPVEDNATQTIGSISVSIAGILTFSGNGGGFDTGTNAQLYGGAISYNLLL